MRFINYSENFDIDADYETTPFSLEGLKQFGVQWNIFGDNSPTIVADALLEACNDDVITNESNWIRITGSAVSINSGDISGIWDYFGCGFRYVRARFIYSSGTSTGQGNFTFQGKA